MIWFFAGLGLYLLFGLAICVNLLVGDTRVSPIQFIATMFLWLPIIILMLVFPDTIWNPRDEH